MLISHQFVGKNKDFLQRLVPPCLLFLPVNYLTIISIKYLTVLFTTTCINNHSNRIKSYNKWLKFQGASFQNGYKLVKRPYSWPQK